MAEERRVVYQPEYGPQGQPISLVAKWGEAIIKEWYWTVNDAQERRDELYDKGWQHVMIRGLPRERLIGDE
jgi:hypothetical protein